MFNKEWNIVLEDEIKKEYFINLLKIVDKEYEEKTIYPIKANIFRVFNEVDYNEVRVVLLGQDPYHGTGEADGRAFSIPQNIKIPPSLRNIFKELENDLGINRTNKDLSDWTKQGIFLLNTVLTVEKDKPLSHRNIGWEIFTDEVIKKLSDREEKIIFILLGKQAQNKKKLIKSHHIIIETSHPSPLSSYRGFEGSKIFSQVNQHLENKKIEW